MAAQIHMEEACAKEHKNLRDDSMSILMASGKTDQYQKGYKVLVAQTNTAMGSVAI